MINILNSFQYEQINMKETTISCREMKVNKEKRKKKQHKHIIKKDACDNKLSTNVNIVATSKPHLCKLLTRRSKAVSGSEWRHHC